MSLGPLDRPADLQSVLPIQVLCALGGLFMVLVEGALAHWSIFHSSAPLIALCSSISCRLRIHLGSRC